MSEDLVRVYLGNKSVDLIKQISKYSPDLAKDINRLACNALDGLGSLALDSYRSAVPIDTQELRDKVLNKVVTRRDAQIPASTVYVANITHYGADKKPINAVTLADILNLNNKNRSQTSNAINGFPSISGTTKNWEGIALKNFKGRIQRFLNDRSFYG